MERYLYYSGLALVILGAVLLVVCYVARWESNAELLTGLLLVVTGYVLNLWLQRLGERY